ncbi:GNAT family N-acetyltransferase [Clostridium sp.]|uniref:GNAT family N-acetyltransferase n=1 Tax=Clostridium sp. TaxID=1506 RepID=UPI002FC6F343
MIEFRKLKHEDYQDMLDISKDIWEGTDYLPHVFHNWVDDNGIFLGGVDSNKNKVIAVAKLSKLYDGSGWLEGLRVHKDYRGQRLGRRISEEMLQRAKMALEQGEIDKIAFSTHITNVESRTMMESLGFKVKQANTLAIKNISSLKTEQTLENFKVEPWNVSFEEFKYHPYFVRRKGFLPLAFVYEEVTRELYEKLKESNCFIKINQHEGVFKYKGEPNFIVMDDTFEGINTFMDYYLLSYKDKEFKELFTPFLSHDKELIEKFKNAGYTSWGDWKPDYFYYVY